jgi:hypothetical protein
MSDQPNTSAEIVTARAGRSALCPTHPYCMISRCRRFLCQREIHVRRSGPGRPKQYCSTRCRVAEHRWLNSP